ncbi:MAG TPA: hypothetical protein VGE11_23130 [Pseudonocardia sp.]
MLHVGPRIGQGGGEDDADLAVFVDRLAAAGSDEATEKAREHVQRVIAEAGTPPGVRRLAEALAASLADRAPAPRRPAEDASTVVAAMRAMPLLILQDFDVAAVAGAVATLIGDGRRVLVTAPTSAELAALAATLRPDVADRALDALPDMAPGELRELRRLLVTAPLSPAAAGGKQLPPAAMVPRPAEVAALCSRIEHNAASGPAAMVPALLSGIDYARREAVTSVARFVHRSLRAMYPRADRQWAWNLLNELIYSRHRPEFDQLLEDTAQAVGALDRARQLPSVAVTAPLPPGALAILRRYGEFLFGGGRTRGYLRMPAERRDAIPVLRLLRVDGRPPETADDVRRGVEHLELGARLARIDQGCHAVGIPAPRDERELTELADGLVRVAAAARSVGALRHDVLFLAADSPLAVPDVDTAEQVAAAILGYAQHGVYADADGKLDRMAAQLAGACPALVPAPEHEAAVRALRARDAPAYAAAVDALNAARRQVADAERQAALLERLVAIAPRLASTWAELAPHDPAGLGFVCLRPMDALLSAMPEADSADVVMVLGAHRLGVERLLLAAAAPRLIAVVPPGETPDESPTALSVLQRAATPVIRGRAAAGRNVVPIGSRSAAAADATKVGKAGA